MGSLRLVEPAALSPVGIPWVWSSDIHLPGALRSPGITRVHRSYGSSDSCPGQKPSDSGQVSLFHVAESSVHSVSNHLSSSCDLGLVAHRRLTARHGLEPFASLSGTRASLGLRQLAAGSPRRPAESSSSPTDWSFTSRCSPPVLTDTRLRSVTKFKPNSGGDFRPADSTCLQAHCHWLCPCPNEATAYRLTCRSSSLRRTKSSQEPRKARAEPVAPGDQRFVLNGRQFSPAGPGVAIT
jgi:hypothetical protein